MTETTRAWRETLNELETSLVYHESTNRQKGKSKEFHEFHRGKVAAVTCARDAIKKKLEKMLEEETE